MWIGCGKACAVLVVLGFIGLGCGQRVQPRATVIRLGPMPVGACNPHHMKKSTEGKSYRRGDRDLNGDGRLELIRAERGKCSEGDNCQWEVYTHDSRGECKRFVGMLQGFALEMGKKRGSKDFYNLLGWWRLGGERLLMQEYQFVGEGYLIKRALLCTRESDGRIRCSPHDE